MLLETLVHQTSVVVKKGRAEASAEILLAYAQTQGMWDFFSEKNMAAVFACLEDGTEDIQNQASQLLLRFFQAPISQLVGDAERLQLLLARAMRLMSSPRSYENNSGLLIMSLVLHRGVLTSDLHLSHDPDSLTISVDTRRQAADTDDPRGDPVLTFVHVLTSQINGCLKAVSGDLVSGLKKYSIHGVTRCVTKTLQDLSKLNRVAAWPTDQWSLELSELHRAMEGVVHLALNILSGSKTEAEMCQALEKLVSPHLSADSEDAADVATMSPEFQLVMSWCWVNLKESCSCLAQLASTALLAPDKSLLPVAAIEEISALFIRVLSQCRHRGAIEGCRAGFSQFCCAVFSSDIAEVREIPAKVLTQILDGLSSQSMRKSVTRRSAGLPIIVQLIVQSAKKTRRPAVLSASVTQLLAIAAEPVPHDHSQHTDLSQGHALNILKAVFSDASLAPALLPYLSRVTILVIRGFDSPSWVIRNSSTQLLGTLMTRMFGPRGNSELQQGSQVTLEEFESQHPDLLTYMRGALSACGDVSACVSASMYVVLTISSVLAMSPLEMHTLEARADLRAHMLRFLCSPVHWLRQLSANSVIALSPLDHAGDTLKGMFEMLPRGGMNHVHGCLLAVQRLATSGALCEADLAYLIHGLITDQVLDRAASCLPVAALRLEILRSALSHTHTPSTHTRESFTDSIWNFVKLNLENFSSKASLSGSVHRERCIKLCFSILASLTSTSGKCGEVLEDLAVTLTSSLVSQDLDMCISSVECVRENMQTLACRPHVQSAVCRLLFLSTTTTTIFQLCGEILLELALLDKLTLEPSDVTLTQVEDLRDKWKSVSGVQSVIAGVESILWSRLPQSELVRQLSSVHRWSREMSEFVSPASNENLRLVSGRGLRLAGRSVLAACCGSRDRPQSGHVVTQLLTSSLTLLDDTETQVRREAAEFICQVRGHGGSAVQANLCYQMVTEVIASQLWWCDELLNYLVSAVYTPGQLTRAVSAYLGPKSSALFEAETCSSLSERHTGQIWATRTLRKLVANGDAADEVQTILPSLLGAAVAGACAELEVEMPRLVEAVRGEPLVNLTFDPHVLSAVLGVKCVSVLCGGHGGQGQSAELKKLQQSLDQLGKVMCCLIINIHPHVYT